MRLKRSTEYSCRNVQSQTSQNLFDSFELMITYSQLSCFLPSLVHGFAVGLQ